MPRTINDSGSATLDDLTSILASIADLVERMGCTTEE
jgi:hypothetical protein